MIKQFFFLFIVLQILACKQKVIYAQSVITKNTINYCFIMKPVVNDSKITEPNTSNYPRIPMDQLLNEAFLDSNHISFDSAMAYVTSFERQKLILINWHCFDKLNNPDSSFLSEIAFNYQENTTLKPSTHYIRSYKKNIYKFGQAEIFEYNKDAFSNGDANLMFIIIKEDENNRYGDDYKGFAFISNGLEWKDYKEFSIPIFIQHLNIHRQGVEDLKIPLFYAENRFIPIGHF